MASAAMNTKLGRRLSVMKTAAKTAGKLANLTSAVRAKEQVLVEPKLHNPSTSQTFFRAQ